MTKLPNCSPIITCQFKGPISESNIAFKALHISDSDLNSCTATKMNIGIETPWKTAFKKNWVSTQTNQDRTETNKNNNFKTETYSFAVLVDDVFYQNNCLSVSVSFISQKLMFVYSTSSFAAIVRVVCGGPQLL